jgi:O-antigen biosynthesis protein
MATLVGRVNRSLKRSLRGIRTSLVGERPLDIAAEYAFLGPEPIGSPLPASDIRANSINWFVPCFPFGAGGHLNIFRFVQMLERRGFECRVIVHASPWFGTPADVRKEICDWFMPIQAPVYVGIESAPPAYFTVATGWHTAYLAARFQPTVCRCYFIQDFEPWFYPKGSDYALVEETYRLGLIGITDGEWLRDKVVADYGMEAHSVGFAIDRRIHFPGPRRIARTRKKLLFYARPSTERRAFELGALVLAEVAKRTRDVEFVLVGADLDSYVLPFRYTAKGVVHPDLLGYLTVIATWRSFCRLRICRCCRSN